MTIENMTNTKLPANPTSPAPTGSAFSYCAQFSECYTARKCRPRGNGFFDCWKDDCLCSSKNCRRIHTKAEGERLPAKDV